MYAFPSILTSSAQPQNPLPRRKSHGYTWDRRLGFIKGVSCLNPPGVEPRFFGISVCSVLGVPTAATRFFIWTSIHAYPYVNL
jgi:hypothetical protein